jgi:hypothetical protein
MMAIPTATTVALRKKARRGAAGCCSGVVSEVMRLLFCSSARGRIGADRLIRLDRPCFVIGYDVVFVPDHTLRLDLSGVTAAVARLTFRR